MIPHLSIHSFNSLEVNTEAPSVVMVIGTPQQDDKSLNVLIMLAESSRASWKIDNQLEYGSQVARYDFPEYWKKSAHRSEKG